MGTITFSRQYGSGGRKIAMRVAEILGYRFFDKRFMIQSAADVGLTENELVDYAEDNYKVKNFFARLTGRSDVVAEVTSRQFDPNSGRDVKFTRALDEKQAIDLVRTAIRAAHERSNVVIVGRGGQVILKGQPDTFHVRIVASPEHRQQRLEQFENLTTGQAVEIIAERDEASKQYMKRFFNADWDDPSLYHMVIDSSCWDVEASAQLIAQGAREFHPVPAVIG